MSFDVSLVPGASVSDASDTAPPAPPLPAPPVPEPPPVDPLSAGAFVDPHPTRATAMKSADGPTNRFEKSMMHLASRTFTMVRSRRATGTERGSL
jgi:hypothetical protein